MPFEIKLSIVVIMGLPRREGVCIRIVVPLIAVLAHQFSIKN